MAAFETPPLGEYPVTPPVREGAMAHSKPFVAKPDHQKAMANTRMVGVNIWKIMTASIHFGPRTKFIMSSAKMAQAMVIGRVSDSITE